MKKAVVIFSGGMDSTTLLYDLSQDHEVYAVSFDYGQRHKRELYGAAFIAKNLGIDWRLGDLYGISSLLKGSSLTSPEIKVPDGHYTDETMRITVVPNRNAIMLSIAWGYATSIGAVMVATGVHAGDHAIYPDCRNGFIESLSHSLELATEGYSDCYRIFAPYVNITKKDIVLKGNELGVPWELTWSCYKGGDLHCGTCGTCVERIEAFKLANVYDPTHYVTYERK